MSSPTPVVGNALVIRAANSSDVAALATLAARLFRQAYGPTHPEPTMSTYLDEAFAPEQLRGELADPAVRVFIAEHARDPIGYLYLRETKGPPPAGVPGTLAVEIVRLYVDAAWHGHGIAQMLVAASESDARVRGADAVWLSVWQEAARPIAFYRRTGFVAVGTSTFRFGDRLDADWLMVKQLTTE